MTKTYKITTNSVEVKCLYDTSTRMVIIVNNGICHFRSESFLIGANVMYISNVDKVIYNN